MKRAPILATAACLAAFGVATEAAAQTRVEVGVLTCNARGFDRHDHRVHERPALHLQAFGP